MRREVLRFLFVTPPLGEKRVDLPTHHWCESPLTSQVIQLLTFRVRKGIRASSLSPPSSEVW